MNTKNLNPSNLMQAIDQAKIKINPLPRHYLADNADVRTRELYASFLGSVMLSNGRVSNVKHRLFTMLLASLDIDTKVETYLSNLESVELEELVKNLDNDNKRQVLIFDSLILMRCDFALNTEQLQLLSGISDLLLLEKDDLIYTLYWTGKLLGIEIKIDLENKNKYIDSFISTDKLKDIQKNYHINSFIQRSQIIIEGIVFKDSESISNFNGVIFDRYLFSTDTKKEYIKLKYSGFVISNTIVEKEKVSLRLIKLPSYLNAWKDSFSQIYP